MEIIHVFIPALRQDWSYDHSFVHQFDCRVGCSSVVLSVSTCWGLCMYVGVVRFVQVWVFAGLLRVWVAGSPGSGARG